MFKYLYEFIEYFINYILVINLFDILKLIDVVDANVVMMPIFREEYFDQALEDYFLLPGWFSQGTLAASFLSTYSTEITLSKLFFFFNLVLVKLFFLQLTPTTFWLLPALLLFIAALILLFFIKPNWTNIKLWSLAIYILIVSIFYQLLLIFIYFDFYQQGYLLKVGSSATYNLPYNLALAKLVLILIIFITLVLTLIFYTYFYWKIIHFIKPEFCSILLFLGFACHMLFLQNDLFSIFLYFEIISFCIYGLLFLHKRTNAQLHALIRYVLFSLWVSTCYIIGVMFHLLSQNFTTSLLYTSKDTSFSLNYGYQIISPFENLIIQEFETVLSLIFILIYFLFKLGVGPFYTWTIEVYNSCSTGSLLAVSLIPKLIYIPTLFFVLFYNFFDYLSFWAAILASMGFITTFIGSFGIVITDKLKEIYAWSSIVHTGNLLLLISTVSTATMSFLIFYLVSYYVISFGYIVILTSLQNWFTGRFIKTIHELNSINMLQSPFFFVTIVILSSAAGFTPFLSFFMKFSLLTIISSYYGFIFTFLIAFFNVIGSIAYLRMLRNIIGFNIDNYYLKSKQVKINFIELNQSYAIAWWLNFSCILILFSFLYYKDFLIIFSCYDNPFFVNEELNDIWEFK